MRSVFVSSGCGNYLCSTALLEGSFKWNIPRLKTAFNSEYIVYYEGEELRKIYRWTRILHEKSCSRLRSVVLVVMSTYSYGAESKYEREEHFTDLKKSAILDRTEDKEY